MNMNPSAPTPVPQKTSYVEQALNASAQKQNVEAVNRLGNRMDSVSKIMSQSVDYEKASLSHLISIDKNIEKLTKGQHKSSEDMKKMLTSVGQTATSSPLSKKDHNQKAVDSNAEQKKTLKSMKDILAEQLKFSKEHVAKKAMGFIEGLGKLLAVGGLLGYMLFGKKEFLMDASKSFKALEASARFAFGAFGKLGKMIKGIKEFSEIGKVADALGKSAKGIKAAGTVLKEVKGAKVLAEVAKTGQKAMIGGKVLSGAAAMSAAKKGLAVAKEASPIASLLGKFGLGAGAKVAGKGAVKVGAKMGLKRIPILGSIMAVGFAIKRLMDGDVMGAIMELGSGALGLLDIVAPGLGTTLSLMADVGIMVRDANRQKGKSGNSSTKVGGGSAPTGDAYNMKNASDITKKNIQAPPLENFFGRVASSSKATVKKLLSAAKSGGTKVMGVARDVAKRAGNALGYMLGGGVNIDGMRPSMLNNFLGLTSDYAALHPGKKIPVNSGYRSIEEQTRMYNDAVAKYGPGQNRVGKPGRSMHNYGYAIDIGDRQGRLMNELKNDGLLDKWGFEFPMANRAVNPEPWHMEPKGFKDKYESVRGGTFTESPIPSTNAVGDAYSIGGGDFPMGSNVNMGTKNNPVVVKLDDESIGAIAKLMAQQPRQSGATNYRNKSGTSLNVRGR